MFKRLLVLIAVLACSSAPSWADSIELDVNAWGTYTATQPCSSNCTETIAMSFLYDTPSVDYPEGEMVPGSFQMSSSGFLGTFSGPSNQRWMGDYMPSFNGLGDEIDLYSFAANEFSIAPGVNTVGFFIYSCQSEICANAFGQTWTADGPGFTSDESSIVTPVQVPDGDSVPWLMVTALGAIGLVWRWRRTDAISFSAMTALISPRKDTLPSAEH